jgi:uncharacterized protein YaiE (UPF0345 family)|tara:strand:- start:147 stop:521 length:375 start_codon:yes stop_codon:yes gene_type:complete
MFPLKAFVSCHKTLLKVILPMSEFTNVSVATEANVYFDGRVISRTIILADGSKKTLGVMLPGEYEFGTEVQELMEISSGAMDVLLPEATEWISITGGKSFEVPANAKFGVVVHEITNYCCSYFA